MNEIKTKQGYIKVKIHGYHRADKQGYVFKHIFIAEKALGKPLPDGSCVHHLNGTKDSGPLVICQDNAYHKLLHQRQRAYDACGNPSWRICNICKKYDDPKNLVIIKKGNGSYHKDCKNRRYYEKKYNVTL